MSMTLQEPTFKVGQLEPGHLRWGARRSLHSEHPARQGKLCRAPPAPAWPVLPVARQRAHDEARVARQERGVTESEPGHHPGRNCSKSTSIRATI